MLQQGLIPLNQRTQRERKEIARQGGVASGKARREKRLIKLILEELLEGKAKDSPYFSKLAKKIGIETEKSIKEVFVFICLLNATKNANLSELEKLAKLLGEDKKGENDEIIAKLDEVLGGIDRMASE